MTTVFFDGQIIAVDSMSTMKKATTNRCIECGTNASELAEYRSKIRVPKWEGKSVIYPGTTHTILGLTGAGDGYLIDAVSEGLARGLPLNGVVATIFTSKGKGQGAKMTETSILLATTHGVFNYHIGTNGKVTVDREEGPYASGSGRTAAMLAYRYLNQNAIGAVAMATLVDKWSAGPINYLDLSDEKPEVKRWAPTKEELESLFEEFHRAETK